MFWRRALRRDSAGAFGMGKGACVIVVGAGAREHALAATLSSADHRVLCAPGNAGTASVGRNVAVAGDDVHGLVDLASSEGASLVVVGPELPLQLGLVDALEARGIAAFGPSKAAARLEGSKVFMKRFCERHGIPTAAFATFDDADEADRYVRSAGRPLVVKADGLAAGKGVCVPDTVQEALDAIDRMMRKREFGDAGASVVIEERLLGEEASFHVVCDVVRGVALAPAQDHKRVGDGDRGPNTGGMGAYAPAPVVDADVHERVMRGIVAPTLEGMASDGAPFRGALFVGLMIDRGVPTVLEYNVRFGDPETTVLVPTYAGDWFELLIASARGDVSRVTSGPPAGSALAVVMAAAGYPAAPRTGDVIEGLDDPMPQGSFVRHAGTMRDPSGRLVTSGGRVLAVGAHGDTLPRAAATAYDAVARIRWAGEHHRTDIGRRALHDRGGRG
jgi:phosphoribosylamine--glycine ligase